MEGETIDRAARIAKLAVELDLDRRRARIVSEQVQTVVTAMDHGLRVAFPDAIVEDRARFVDAAAEMLKLHEAGPSELLDRPKQDP